MYTIGYITGGVYSITEELEYCLWLDPGGRLSGDTAILMRSFRRWRSGSPAMSERGRYHAPAVLHDEDDCEDDLRQC